MGRPIKATEDHIKDGTYRKDRHANRGVTLDVLKEIPVPGNLNKAAAEKWTETVPTLQEAGVISSVDLPHLIYAFEQYGDAQDCLNSVRENFSNAAEYLMQLNKFKDVDLLARAKDCMNEYMKTIEKFAVTPASRAKIKVQPKKEDEADSFIKSLRGNG